MRKSVRRIVSILLTICVLSSCVAVGAFNTQAASVDYGLADSVQEGQILQCWNWSFNNIKNNMERIAEQGFTAIQTSPIQTTKESTKESYSTMSNSWWVYYQPIGFGIETNSYNALGTVNEFKAMCNKAHEYGIKVIVDTIFNHLSNNNRNNTVSSLIDSDIRDDSSCWYNVTTNISNYFGSRYELTHRCLGGLPDLNTGNTKIQNYAIGFLKQCIDAGADGFRFDAARHIETPWDDNGTASDFWPNVLNAATSYAKSTRNITPYYYGEILDSLNGLDPYAYTQYMSVTDNTSSNSIRNSVAGGNASGAVNSSITLGSAPNKTVQWNESHDTYADGSSRGISNSDVNKTWAIVGSRNEVCGMYLARPASNSDKLGTAGITGWANAEVKAVNQFKNAFAGQSEYMASSGSIAYVERGTTGVTLVNVSGTTTSVNVPAHTMASGTYTDVITGNKFTVSNGYIKGTIGSTGIAVVYNEPPKATVTPGTSSYRTDTLKLTLSYENATSGQYSINGGSYKSYTAGATITIGEGLAYDEVTTVAVKATDGTNTSAVSTYTYTKIDPSTPLNVYFDNGSYGWTYVYAYFYDENNNEATAWPGTRMTLDGDTDYNCVDVPSGFENGYVIFNNNDSSQLPPSGQEGFKLTGETVLFQSGSLGSFTPTELNSISGQLHFVPGDWASGTVSLQAYVWNGENNAWVTFADSDGDGTYTADLPEGEWKRVKFCRVNPGGSSSNPWDNVWNKTATQTIPQGMNCFTVNSGEWNDATGSWSCVGEVATTTPPEIGSDSSYFLSGTFNEWSQTENVMVYTSSNVVSTTIEVEADSYEFKIADTNGVWYGNKNTISDATATSAVSNWAFSNYVTQNCVLDASGGTYKFNLNTSTMVLEVLYTPSVTVNTDATEETTVTTESTAETVSTTVYISGTMNNWGKTEMTKSGDVATYTTNLVAGTYSFKIVDTWWYGSGSSFTDTVTDLALDSSAENCVLTATGGTYMFKFNASSKELTVTCVPFETEETESSVQVGSDSSVAIAGSFNSWDRTANMMTYSSSDIVKATIKLDEGTYKFKVVDTWWYGNTGVIVDTTTTTSAVGWQMSTTAGDCTLQATGGTYTFSFNRTTKMLTVEFEPNPTEAVEIGSDSTASLAGSFNSWDKTATMLKYETSDVVTTSIKLSAGTYSFKIVDTWWYGNDTTITDSVSEIALNQSAGNCILKATGGTYTFKFNLSTKKLSISCVLDETEATTATQPSSEVGSTSTVSLAGSFNSWDKTATMMTYTSDEVVTATLELDEGTYKFKVVDTWWYGNSGTIKDTTTTTSAVGWEMSKTAGDCTLQASGGTYTFNYNISTGMLEILYTPSSTSGSEDETEGSTGSLVGTTSAVSIAGSFNSWDKTSDLMKYISDDVVSTTLELSQGSYKFKIVNGWWFGNSGTIVDTTTTTSAVGWEMSNTAGDCTLQASGGIYTFNYNISTNMLEILYTPSESSGSDGETEDSGDTLVGTASTVSIAGSFNNWNKTANMMVYESGDVVETTLELSAGTYEFKIVDEFWYGNNGTIVDTTTATSAVGWEMSNTAGNCKLKASGGSYTFSYNRTTKMLTVLYKA